MFINILYNKGNRQVCVTHSLTHRLQEADPKGDSESRASLGGRKAPSQCNLHS